MVDGAVDCAVLGQILGLAAAHRICRCFSALVMNLAASFRKPTVRPSSGKARFQGNGGPRVSRRITIAE